MQKDRGKNTRFESNESKYADRNYSKTVKNRYTIIGYIVVKTQPEYKTNKSQTCIRYNTEKYI